MAPIAGRLRAWIVRFSKVREARSAVAEAAERPHSVEETERLGAAHRENVLGVYDAMAGSFLSHTGTATDPASAWSLGERLHLEIYLNGWPPEDLHHMEAMEDLKSWPEAVGALAEFEKAFDAAHDASGKVLEGVRGTLREFLGGLGLAPQGHEPGSERGYNEPGLVRRAVLQRVAESDRYDVSFVWDPAGSICAVQDGQSREDLFHGLPADEAPRMIELLQHLPQKLDEFRRDRNFFAKLTGDVLKLQIAFTVAETALFQLRCGLEPAREDLREGPGFPDGGRCGLCQEIRRRTPGRKAD